jgi:hypothetical protein
MSKFVFQGAIGAILAALVLGCGGDSTGPTVVEKPAADLHFLKLSASAPTLQSTVVSFYAKKGTDREVRVRFSNGEDFLRFRVSANSLLQRPDGSAFASGDSVLITITITDPAKLAADFQPAGLKFSPSTPARLQFEFGEADKDLNDDGTVNATDSSLIPLISTWRQEMPGGSWLKVSSNVEIEINEVQADIFGFSGYALAY